MASPNANALAGYLFERLRNDIQFMHSQNLFDSNERDMILSRIDGASQRANANAGSSAGGVAALTSQFSGANLSAVANNNMPPPPPHHHQLHQAQPPPMPARNTYVQPAPHQQQHDDRERVKALWAYNATQPDDLTFQKNDIIIITQKENEHWFRGFVQNDPSARAGLFPSNYVEPVSNNQVGPYSPSGGLGQSYYSTGSMSSDAEKAAMQPYQSHPPPPVQYYNQGPPAPPQHQYYQQPPQQQIQQQAPSPSEPGKKNRFKLPGSGNGLGNTLAHAGVGGLGFGAGSALASNVVNAIL